MSRWPTIPPDIDPATHQPIDPETLGVLTLAAAQPNQEAREIQTEDGPHGAFTWALAQALRYASEPMDRIFARTMAALGAERRHAAARHGRPVAIFQDDPGPASGRRRRSHRGGGFGQRRRHPFARRRRYRPLPQVPPQDRRPTAVTVEIASSEGLGGSIAHVGGPRQRQGWRHPGAGPLGGSRQSRPARLDSQTGSRGRRGARRHRVRETARRSRHRLARRPHRRRSHPRVSWNGSAWILETNPATKPAILGAEPTAADVKSLLPPKARLLVRLPPTSSLLTAIPLGDPDHSAVEIAPPPLPPARNIGSGEKSPIAAPCMPGCSPIPPRPVCAMPPAGTTAPPDIFRSPFAAIG